MKVPISISASTAGILRGATLLAIVFLPAPTAWGATGNGQLSVSNNGLCDGDGYTGSTTPTHFNVLSGHTIHVNIAPSGLICTAGNPNKFNDSCTQNSDCAWTGNCVGPAGSKTCTNTGASCTVAANCTVPGVCQSTLECSGDTNVYFRGTDNTPCTADSDCMGPAETACDTDLGFCKFINAVPVTVGAVTPNQIDFCYEVSGDMCLTTVVAYCGDSPGDFLANASIPMGSQTNATAGIRPVEAGTGTCADETPCVADATCAGIGSGKCHYPETACVPDQVVDCNSGAVCCGLTQGAYGAPGGVANGAGNGDCSDPEDMGYITLAQCNAGTDPFGGGAAPNETTIGVFGTKSVTVLDQATLISYLPAGGTASSLSAGTGDKQYSGGTITPPAGNVSGSGSKGNGAGVLAGQTMACQLNAFLSDSELSPGGFSAFTVPATLFCTRRSGADKTLDNDDDVCQAFNYPACAAGLTVSQLVQCSNEVMAGVAASCPCGAKDLNAALDNINVQFDQCGHAIDCGSVTVAGQFTCQSL